jgi:hypothetical protein
MSHLSEFVPTPQYQASRHDKFPSAESLRWQIRRHRDALVGAGALAEIAGRLFIHPEKADLVFIQAGTRRIAETPKAGALAPAISD